MPCPFLERISFFSRSPITHLTVSSFIDLCSSCPFRLHFLCLFPSPYRRVTLACKHILKLSPSFSLLPVHSILSLMCVLQRVEMTHSLWAVRFTLVLLPVFKKKSIWLLDYQCSCYKPHFPKWDLREITSIPFTFLFAVFSNILSIAEDKLPGRLRGALSEILCEN